MKKFFENLNLSVSIVTALITIVPVTFVILMIIWPNKFITEVQAKWIELSKPTGYTYYKPMYKNKMAQDDTTPYTLLKEIKKQNPNPASIDCYIKLSDGKLEPDKQRNSFCNLQVLDVLQAATEVYLKMSPSVDSDQKTVVKQGDCVTLLETPQKDKQTPIESVTKGTRQGGWVYAALTDCSK